MLVIVHRRAVSVYRVLQMRGGGYADVLPVLQVPDNKADAVPCERLQIIVPEWNNILFQNRAICCLWYWEPRYYYPAKGSCCSILICVLISEIWGWGPLP
jgi:hypothetical protein